ncbi:hypothetical protein CSAL01_04473 [Colletotrichum salicis]|uniref:Heterokaryon incompatibility domain-containing protein n=1 Tax=Colletotrichum salicis TaxID=1209931 RepID=A0A135RQT9_9PEZI|nr:hypothetical protein CSAL01_04473 [Colletotrichum salicis]
MTRLLGRLDRKKATLTLLTQTLNLRSTQDIKTLLIQNQSTLNAAKQDVREPAAYYPEVPNFRPASPDSLDEGSVVGVSRNRDSVISTTEFDFDYDLINTKTYRRALQRYASVSARSNSSVEQRSDESPSMTPDLEPVMEEEAEVEDLINFSSDNFSFQTPLSRTTTLRPELEGIEVDTPPATPPKDVAQNKALSSTEHLEAVGSKKEGGSEPADPLDESKAKRSSSRRKLDRRSTRHLAAAEAAAEKFHRRRMHGKPGASADQEPEVSSTTSTGTLSRSVSFDESLADTMSQSSEKADKLRTRILAVREVGGTKGDREDFDQHEEAGELLVGGRWTEDTSGQGSQLQAPRLRLPLTCEPLRTSRSTRVVEILKFNKDNLEIFATLHQVTLCDTEKETTKYVALSYTLGHPVTFTEQWGPYSARPERTVAKAKLILVNPGDYRRMISDDNAISDCSWVDPSQLSEYEMTENLSDFLMSLTSRSEERGAHIPLIWIDAICIDRTNPQEKAVQIPLMGEIYAKSSAVYIWLGKHDRDLEGLFWIYRTLLPAIKERQKKSSSFQAFFQWLQTYGPGDGRLLEDLGLKPEKASLKDRWITYIMIFSTRSWFFRAWTLQEAVVVASNPVFLIGNDFHVLG